MKIVPVEEDQVRKQPKSAFDALYIIGRKAFFSQRDAITSETIAAYEALAMSYLTIPNLPAYLGELDELAAKEPGQHS
jgi:hypothetical protein